MSFQSAFPGLIDRRIDQNELIQVINQDIAAEFEAIYLYQAHANATDDAFVKKVLLDIAREEKVHVGELLTVLNYLDPEMAEDLMSGQEEVRGVLNDLKK